ncbi:silicon efflux transporter LSI3-like [Amaranthus tricolor]|uniref:silicon efflux transporter LSI3-like n=1 Tax=Amaranthus tricolor TaxID=29722 RepID=UPI002588F2DF|nr:silicon efflux transporter LSI3-like [Amaranthus tricolor]
MAMAPIINVVLGSVAFAVFWVLVVFHAVPFLPIGSTAGSLLGAMLMVIFGVMSPEQAYDAIDLPILGLLFGTMVVSVYLERADLFKYLVCSAFFTNDTACVVLTEFVLNIARQHNLPPYPFLLALATSANIGSSTTPIGNPQNLVIAVQSKISFGNFLVGLLPAVLVGVLVNALIIIGTFWKLLSTKQDLEHVDLEIVASEKITSHQVSPITSHHLTDNHESPGRADACADSSNKSDVSKGVVEDLDKSFQQKEETRTLEGLETTKREFTTQLKLILSGKEMSEKWKHLSWKICVYFITMVMLIALVFGLNMSWTTITASLALVVHDFKDARPSLEKVSYPILIFFCGMFITVDGFNRTGVPNKLWDIMEPYSRIDHVGGIAMLSLVIIVLSNVISNVPTGMNSTCILVLILPFHYVKFLM